jgi:4-aminobutyrate aminotransferase
MGALSLTGSKAGQRAGFSPLVPGVIHAPYPDPYRPPLGSTAQTAAQAVLEYIEGELFGRLVPAEEVAAVFVEPMLGEGGYVTPPPDFLPGLRAMCDRHGIVLVCDEVQSGIGRTGRWWAVDHVNVVPDIVVTAKGLASGMPLGAIVARADLMSWKPGSHGTTFGGNPVCCAAGLATLAVIEDEGLMENASVMGRRLLAGLAELALKYPAIGDVRGTGLWVAADLVRDRQSKEPDAALRDRVIQEAFRRHMLVLGAGRSAVRFMPGLVVGADEVDQALACLDASLSAALSC